jgi:hypothetical protein
MLNRQTKRDSTMLQLKATQLQLPVPHEAAIDISNNEVYVSFRSAEILLNLREDSFREILASKSLKAALGKEIVSGKFKAKLLGTERTGTPSQNVITSQLLVKVAKFVDTSEAREFLAATAELGYNTMVLTSAGIDVAQAYVDIWWKARECMKKDFQPLLSAWNKQDGEPVPYAGFIQNFKRAAKVPLKNPEDMTSAELQRYDDMIKRYDLLRLIGLSDKEARSKINGLY